MRRVRPPNGGVLIPKNLLWQKGRLYEVEWRFVKPPYSANR